jgi:uncharacterized protein YjbI with pentapeptide repeats
MLVGIVCHTDIGRWYANRYRKMLQSGECTVSFTPNYRLDKERIGGGHHTPPIKGFFVGTKIYELDVKGQYPSIAIKNNFSFDTLNCTCCKNNENARVRQETIDAINEQLQENNIRRTVDRYWVCQRRRGAYPTVLEQTLHDRDKYLILKKEELHKANPDPKLIEEYHTYQIGAKLFANAGYGLFANEYFEFANYQVAECITAEGRRIHKQMEVLGQSEPYNFEVVFGFTDSAFFKATDAAVRQDLIEIASFFNERKLDELSVLYFAGHGIKGDDSELYLAAVDTKRKSLVATATSAYFVNKVMLNCRSKRQVLILDCCNSGTFPQGIVARTDNNIHTNDYLKGQGGVILTASDAMQYAFEGEYLKEEGVVTSVFTHALIQGLRSGDADTDRDGMISHVDLYDYLLEHVRSQQPNQTPCMWADVQGKIFLAQKQARPITERKSRDREFMIKLLQDGKVNEFNLIRKEEDMRLNLRNIDLSGKSLVGADLHDVDLTGAILVGSKLGMSILNGAKLLAVNLTGADLKGVDFSGANLTKANLSKSDLRGAAIIGMVDFTDANLTGADLRGADLSGMINFNRAILIDIDFTGTTADKGLVYLKGATIHNARGLQYSEANEYLEALKSYSEALSKQFKTLHTPTSKVISVEEKVKDLVKEVEGIVQPEQITLTKRKDLSEKFTDMVERATAALLDTTVFAILEPFNKLIQLQRIVEAVGWFSRGETSFELSETGT